MERSVTQEFLRRNRDELVAELRAAGAKFKGNGNACICPFHVDRNASGSVYTSEGAWLFKCHGCDARGDVFDVQARRTGKTLAEVLAGARPEDAPKHRPAPKRPAALQPGPLPPVEEDAPRPARVFSSIDALAASVGALECPPYVYANPQTKAAEMVVMRCRDGGGKKHFIQASPAPDGTGFVMRAPPKPWPIYNRTRVLAAKSVVVVEGEKCVHALAALGIVATTSPGGAGKAAHADWSPCAGKLCYLWADNDPDDDKGKSKGVEHMRDIAQILDNLVPPARVMLVDHASLALPAKGDAADFIDQWEGDSPEQIRQTVQNVLDGSRPTGPAAELYTLLEDTISGKRSAIPWPYRMMSQLTNALMPATVTAICGDPGSGKSFLGLEAFGYWITSNVNAAAFMLEDDRDYHLNRVLAQLDENSNLTDPGWVREHAEDTREAFDRHAETIERIGRCIRAASDDEVTLDALGDWAEEKAQAGARIILIDPVTAAAVSDKPWLDDRKFIIRVKAIARRFGASIVLMTHPRKGKRGSTPSLDDMGGGAAYPRFSHTVLWVIRHDAPKDVRVQAGYPQSFGTRINRTVRLGKTRNGRGAGLELGFDFLGNCLRFSEQGVIIGDAEEGEVRQAIVGRPVAPRVEAQQDPFRDPTTN